MAATSKGTPGGTGKTFSSRTDTYWAKQPFRRTPSIGRLLQMLWRPARQK